MVILNLKDEAETRVSIAKTGKSLRSFAKGIGISHAYLSQVLSGKRKPSPTVAHKLAVGLNLEIADIFLIETSADNGHKEVIQ